MQNKTDQMKILVHSPAIIYWTQPWRKFQTITEAFFKFRDRIKALAVQLITTKIHFPVTAKLDSFHEERRRATYLNWHIPHAYSLSQQRWNGSD